jgi:hypothetical protein
MPVALCRGGFAPTRGMSSRREVTPEALESSGGRNAGIAMCRTPIGSREVSWLRINVMGSISRYGHCASYQKSILRSLGLGRTIGGHKALRFTKPSVLVASHSPVAEQRAWPFHRHDLPAPRTAAAHFQNQRFVPLRIAAGSIRFPPLKVAIGMVPLRESKVPDPEVPLTHILDIYA